MSIYQVGGISNKINIKKMLCFLYFASFLQPHDVGYAFCSFSTLLLYLCFFHPFDIYLEYYYVLFFFFLNQLVMQL